jgi:hypothetical protein
MLNALIYRPGEHTWEKMLGPGAAFYDSDDEDNAIVNPDEIEDMIAEGQMQPALHEQGAYFVAALICADTTWRLPVNRTITERDLAHMFNTGTYLALKARFHQGEKNRQNQQPDAPRSRTRRRLTIALQRYSPERAIDLGLEEAGMSTRIAVELVGPDINIDGLATGQLDNIPGVRTSLDQLMNQCWQDFLRDLIQVSPSSSRGGRYCTLSAEEREHATEALYKETALPFRVVVVKWTEAEQWDILLFQRYFPNSAQMASKSGTTLQHWPSCHYWRSWNQVLQDVPSSVHQEEMRRKLLEHFRQLTWLPWCSTDRIWVTKKRETGRYVRLPLGQSETSPTIALNARVGVPLHAITLR